MVFFLPSVSIQSMVTMIAAGKDKKDSKMKKNDLESNHTGSNSSKTNFKR